MDASENPRWTLRRIGFGSQAFRCIGLMAAFLAGYSWATTAPPTEHKGLTVEVLGFVPAESTSAQVGLEDHKLLLPKITIAPGGHIARHSHAKVPGVVQMISGTWIEGHASGETEHSAGDTFIQKRYQVAS